MISIDVSDVVGRPYVVEVLDALSEDPSTVAKLAAAAHTGTRALRPALRWLAASGLIRSTGSLDGRAVGRFRLTSSGEALVRHLHEPATWDALYGR